MLVDYRIDKEIISRSVALASEGFCRAVFEDSSKSDDSLIIPVKKEAPSIDVLLLTHELESLQGLERIHAGVYIEIAYPQLNIQLGEFGYGSERLYESNSRLFAHSDEGTWAVEIVFDFAGNLIHSQLNLDNSTNTNISVIDSNYVAANYVTSYITNEAEITPFTIYHTNGVIEYSYEEAENSEFYHSEFAYTADIENDNSSQYNLQYMISDYGNFSNISDDKSIVYEKDLLVGDFVVDINYTVNYSSYIFNLSNNSSELTHVEIETELAYDFSDKNIMDITTSNTTEGFVSIEFSSYLPGLVIEEEELKFDFEKLNQIGGLSQYRCADASYDFLSTSNGIIQIESILEYMPVQQNKQISSMRDIGIELTFVNVTPIIEVVELNDNYEIGTSEEAMPEINQSVYAQATITDFPVISQTSISGNVNDNTLVETDISDLDLVYHGIEITTNNSSISDRDNIDNYRIIGFNLILGLEEMLSANGSYEVLEFAGNAHDEYSGIRIVEEGYYQLATVNVDESLEGRTLLDAAYQALLDAGFDVELETQTFFDAEIGEEITGRYIVLRKDGKEYKFLESELTDEELKQYGIEIKLNGRRPEYRGEIENPLEKIRVNYGDTIEVDVVVQGVYNDEEAITDCGAVRVAYQMGIDADSNLQELVDSYDNEEARMTANEFLGEGNFELNAYIQRKGQDFAVRHDGDFSEVELQEGDVLTLQYDSNNN